MRYDVVLFHYHYPTNWEENLVVLIFKQGSRIRAVAFRKFAFKFYKLFQYDKVMNVTPKSQINSNSQVYELRGNKNIIESKSVILSFYNAFEIVLNATTKYVPS